MTDADKPKISKHHAGQHPTLQSFRAFDIIPANKVKPSHTARPVISSPVKHFDTTLAPPKPETPTPPKKTEPDTAATAQTGASPSAAPISETEPETPEQVAVSGADAPAAPAEQPPAPEPVAVQTATETEATAATDQKPDTVEQPAAPEETSAVAAAASQPDQKPNTSDQPPLPAADASDLSSIIDSPTPKTDAPSENARPVSHSEEFKNVLKEFATAQLTENEAKPHVVIHKHDYLRMLGIGFLWLLAVAAVAALVLDILLDTGVLTDFYSLPHTNFFGK